MRAMGYDAAGCATGTAGSPSSRNGAMEPRSGASCGGNAPAMKIPDGVLPLWSLQWTHDQRKSACGASASVCHMAARLGARLAWCAHGVGKGATASCPKTRSHPHTSCNSCLFLLCGGEACWSTPRVMAEQWCNGSSAGAMASSGSLRWGEGVAQPDAAAPAPYLCKCRPVVKLGRGTNSAAATHSPRSQPVLRLHCTAKMRFVQCSPGRRWTSGRRHASEHGPSGLSEPA